MSLLTLNVPQKRPLVSSIAQYDSAVPQTLIGRWQFGDFAATDAESRELGKRNRAPGADNASVSLFSAPVVDDAFWTFDGGDDAVRTSIREPQSFTVYAVVRTRDSGIGADAASRARVFGFRGASGAGAVLYANTATVWRAFAYDTTTFRTTDVTVASVASWVRLAWVVSATNTQLFDLTTGTPSALVSFVGPRAPSEFGFTVGDGLIDTFTKSCDVHSIELHNAAHDSTQRALINAQMTVGLGLVGLIA